VLKENEHSPLHVSPLSPSESEDSVLDEDVEGHGVDSLLVDENERPRLLLGVDVLIADEVLELDNLLELGVHEPTFRLDELLSLLGVRVEEGGVDLAVEKKGRKRKG